VLVPMRRGFCPKLAPGSRKRTDHCSMAWRFSPRGCLCCSFPAPKRTSFYSEFWASMSTGDETI
jgi:hypothetical protein